MEDIDRVLSSAEAALERGARPDLRALGFWRAVAAVKREPALVTRYGARIARIDRETFLRTAPIALPARVGVVLLTAGTAASAALVASAGAFAPLLREVALLAGVGALIAATHGLAHYVVGGVVGIRFTHWFSLPPRRPQPGFKTDYASYLRAPARARAWMHASGAIVSKVIPFAAVPVAVASGVDGWAVAVLLTLGIAQLATDALFSVRASDWKRFRRELRAARREGR